MKQPFCVLNCAWLSKEIWNEGGAHTLKGGAHTLNDEAASEPLT